MAYAFSSRRAMAFLMISTMLVGCTADGLMPLASIDTRTQVGSIHPMTPPAPLPDAPVQQGYPVPQQPAVQAYSQNQNNDSLSREVYAPDGGNRQPIGRAVTLGAPPASLGTLTLSASGNPVAAENPGSARVRGEGVADPAADSRRVVGLAEEQDNDISAVMPRQSVTPSRKVASVVPQAAMAPPTPVPGAGYANGAVAPRRMDALPSGGSIAPGPLPSGSVARGPVSSNSAPAEPRWSDQSRVIAPSRPKPEPEQVAMLRPNSPAGALESPRMDAPADGPMPASEISCRRELQRMGVEFRDKPRISDGPSCGIDYPVELSGLSGDIDVKPSVTLNCQTTLAFAKWVKNELAPSSRLRYLTGVKTIEPLGGYSCRRMNNSRQRYNPMSEHARGNAIDVGKFVLKNGHEIDVRKKGLFSFREGALLKAVRSDSCKYFNTVLGPGSNPEHWNHFHFDLRSRATGNRYCD